MLAGQIKKNAAQKVMDKLSDEGHLINKQYNSKIYLANQNFFQTINEKEINDVDNNLEQINKELEIHKNENNKLNNEYKNLNITLTNEEIDKKISEYSKEVADLEKKLRMIENKQINPVPEYKVIDAEENYNKQLNFYKKTKKICFNLVDSLSDGLEMKRNEFFVILMFI